MPWNNNTWFNSLTLVGKLFWNFPKCLGLSVCFPHGQPVCLWTTAILGRAIPAFLTWTTFMDKLESIQFLVHHQTQLSIYIYIYIYEMGSSFTFFKPLDLSRSNGKKKNPH